MSPTFLERYVFLGLDPDSGEFILDDVSHRYAVACATLVQGMLDGRLRLADTDSSSPRLEAAEAAADRPEVYEKAYEAAAGRSFQDAILALMDPFRSKVPSLIEHALSALSEQGAVDEHRTRRFGLVPHTEWRVKDAARLKAERDGLGEALRSGSASADQIALVSVAHGSGLLRKLFPEVPKATLAEQAEALTQGQESGEALAEALRRFNTIMIMAAVGGGG